MAWTQTEIDELKAAMATGVLEVEYEGPPKRRVRYHSLADMTRQLALMQAEVSGGSRAGSRFASVNKGLG